MVNCNSTVFSNKQINKGRMREKMSLESIKVKSFITTNSQSNNQGIEKQLNTDYTWVGKN
jgi:hypothetical protein